MTEESVRQSDDVEAAIDQAVEAVSVRAGELGAIDAAGAAGDPIGLDGLLAVPVEITVRVGRTRIPLATLVELAPGSLVQLDREAHEPADVLVNGKLMARGEIVTIDEKLGVRITSVENAR